MTFQKFQRDVYASKALFVTCQGKPRIQKGKFLEVKVQCAGNAYFTDGQIADKTQFIFLRIEKRIWSFLINLIHNRSLR